MMRLAGPRAPISPDAESRVYDRVHGEWLASTGKPDGARVYGRVHREWRRSSARSKLRRWGLPFALAASAVLAVLIFMPPARVPPLPIGTVVKVVNGGAGGGDFALGDAVLAGETLSTGAGQGLSLLLTQSESLRIAENTVLRMEAKNRFALVNGRVYADTGEFVYRDGGLLIETPMGSVRDIGTQFAVSLGSGRLDVAVREGRVDVQSETEEFAALAGERLRLGQGASAVVEAVSRSDEYWDWATALAPSYDSRGKSVLDVLKWAARETGQELDFQDDELRMAAMRAELGGSVSGFTPAEAIKSALATTSFQYRIESDRIVIRR